MKILVGLAVAAISVIHCTIILEDLDTEWSKFKDTHGKVYKNAIEERLRKSIFKDNYELIKTHNVLYEQGTVSYFLKINKYADMTEQERKASLRGFKVPKDFKISDFENSTFVPDPNTEVPDTFDWKDRDAVTSVKDQRQCGSCWAFSATGSIETQYFFKTGKLVSLSEQNLVDCSHEDENYGCGGGWMNSAFKYVWSNDGIDSEESYPYEGSDGTCRYTVDTNVTSLRGFQSIEAGNEDDLKAAVAQVGTISVAIDATGPFSFYGGGVYYNENCKDGTVDLENDLDHGVLVVGYGTENNEDYWLVKNSWSAYWGSNFGYIKMARNKNNNCGIATLASFPLMY